MEKTRASKESPERQDDTPNRDPPPRYPWAKLMALRRLDAGSKSPDGGGTKSESFQGLIGPVFPAESKIAFGGHAYAQAAYAASKTVKKGFVLHNISGSFSLPGLRGIPFSFTVHHVRDGGTYCLRTVEVLQNDQVRLTCLCGFKRVEKGYNFGHQPAVNLREKYKLALDGKEFHDHPLAPGLDKPWWVEEVKRGNKEPMPFAGVESRKVDMRRYNSPREVDDHPERYRQLYMYRMMWLPSESEEDEGESRSMENIKKADEDGDYDNLYICAHLFASDRNSLYSAAWALGRANDINHIASLNHTVIFHTHGPAIRMGEMDGIKPFTLEMATGRSGENRVLHNGRIWAADGTLIASTMQDGLLRLGDARL